MQPKEQKEAGGGVQGLRRGGWRFVERLPFNKPAVLRKIHTALTGLAPVNDVYFSP